MRPVPPPGRDIARPSRSQGDLPTFHHTRQFRQFKSLGHVPEMSAAVSEVNDPVSESSCSSEAESLCDLESDARKLGSPQCRSPEAAQLRPSPPKGPSSQPGRPRALGQASPLALGSVCGTGNLVSEEWQRKLLDSPAVHQQTSTSLAAILVGAHVALEPAVGAIRPSASLLAELDKETAALAQSITAQAAANATNLVVEVLTLREECKQLKDNLVSAAAERKALTVQSTAQQLPATAEIGIQLVMHDSESWKQEHMADIPAEDQSMLTRVIEEKLRTVFAASPEQEHKASTVENSFMVERLKVLERQIAKLKKDNSELESQLK